MFNASLIYFFSSGLSSAVPFLLLPILTRYLTPAEYGLVALIQVVIALASAVVGLGLNGNVARRFFVLDREDLAVFIGTLVLILGVSSVLCLGVALLAVLTPDDIMGIPDRWIVATPVIGAMNMLSAIHLATLRDDQRVFAFAVFQNVRTLIATLLSVALVVWLAMGWEGRMLGLVAGSAWAGIAGFHHLRRLDLLRFAPTRGQAEDIIRFSLPLVLHVAAVTGMSVCDRLFIEHYLGTAEVGLYSVGFTFATVVGMYTAAVSRAWSPWFMRSMRDSSEVVRRSVVRNTYLNIALMLAAALAVSGMAGPILLHWVDPRYHAAVNIVPWIAIALALHGGYLLLSQYFTLLNDSKTLSLVTLTASLVNIAANYLLIPLHGTAGAAQATVIAYATSCALAWLLVQRRRPMPWLSALTRTGGTQP